MPEAAVIVRPVVTEEVMVADAIAWMVFNIYFSSF